MDRATKQNKGSLSVWHITREQGHSPQGNSLWIQGLKGSCASHIGPKFHRLSVLLVNKIPQLISFYTIGLYIQNLQYPGYNYDIDQRLLRLIDYVRNNWCPPVLSFFEWLSWMIKHLWDELGRCLQDSNIYPSPPASLQELPTKRLLRKWVMISYITRILTMVE